MSRATPPPERSTYPRVANLNVGFALLTVLLLASVVRLLPLGAAPYPLNDGALFARMAEDLSRNGLSLPLFTTYNGEAIPFAYPPLALYLTAILAQILNAEPYQILRWLPAVLSIASVAALYLVAAELLRSRWRGIVAAAAFAFMPRSYVWLIVGGGVTRALGLFFALMALHQAALMLRQHRVRNVAGTALFGGLTALAHPQAAVFLGASIATLLAFHVFRGRPLTSITQTLIAGAGGLVVASPWLLTVIVHHGIAPVLSAARTGFDPTIGLGQLLGLAIADWPVFDLMGALGVLGILVRIARRQWMIPTWLIATVLIDPRAGLTYATVPLALSVVPILGELFSRMVPAQGGSATLDASPLPMLLRRHRAAALLAVLLLFVTLRTASRTGANDVNPLHGLQSSQAAAMIWARTNTPPSAVFAVVTDRYWEADYLSEWFPVVAQRTSSATVQGSEWRGVDAFLQRLAMYRQLQTCASRTDRCITDWLRGWRQPPTYVFLPKGPLYGPNSPDDCCPALRETLTTSNSYLLVYDGPGASIFAPADGAGSGFPSAPTSK